MKLVLRFFLRNLIYMYMKVQYSATSIIQTPLATALMLAYQISEIVWITEVLSFLT